MKCHCLFCDRSFVILLDPLWKPEFNSYMKARSIKLKKDLYVACPECGKTHGIEKDATPEDGALVQGVVGPR